MNAALLALLIGAVYFAPTHIAGWAQWSLLAIEYSGYGIESTVLWAVLGFVCRYFEKLSVAERHAMAAVCAWGAFEAIQRPICRCMFDMTHKVPMLAGQTLCEAAFGLPIGWFGFIVAGAVIARLAGAKNGG